MKILYIASGSSMAGGATKSLLAMLRQADIAKIKYEVVCPNDFGLACHLREIGVKVHVTPYRHACLPQTVGLVNKIKWLPRLLHNTWINLKAKSVITKIAKESKPDIIHENSSAIDIGFFASKRLGIPNVIHIREYGKLDFKMELPGRDLRLKNSNVYTISITKDIAKYKHQDTSDRGTQIYNGIITASQIRYSKLKKPYILYAGHITKAKGVTDLVRSYIEYAKNTKNPLKLYIAGGCHYPNYLNELKKLITKAGVSDLVNWLGEVKNIDELMYEATVTVIPSKFEALGRVMPEAMANGSLCIGRNTGGTKEQMDNGRKFIGKEVAYSFESVDELTKLLIVVANKAKDPATFDTNGIFYNMIKDSQKAVLEFFSETRFGEKLIDFYNKILTDRNGS